MEKSSLFEQFNAYLKGYGALSEKISITSSLYPLRVNVKARILLLTAMSEGSLDNVESIEVEDCLLVKKKNGEIKKINFNTCRAEEGLICACSSSFTNKGSWYCWQEEYIDCVKNNNIVHVDNIAILPGLPTLS